MGSIALFSLQSSWYCLCEWCFCFNPDCYKSYIRLITLDDGPSKCKVTKKQKKKLKERQKRVRRVFIFISTVELIAHLEGLGTFVGYNVSLVWGPFYPYSAWFFDSCCSHAAALVCWNSFVSISMKIELLSEILE